MKKIFCYILITLRFFLASAQSFLDENDSVASKQKIDENKLLFSGYIRSSASGLSKKYNLANFFGEVSLNINKYYKNFTAFANLRLRTGYEFNSLTTKFEIKEAYLSYLSKGFDISIGEQIIVWGRTDGISPLNIITPQNYFFISANPDDMLMPNIILKSLIKTTNYIQTEILIIPLFKQSIYRYDLFDLESFASSSNVYFVDNFLPKLNFKNTGLGARSVFDFKNISFSVCYLNAYSINPAIAIQNFSFSGFKPSIKLHSKTFKKQTFGIDGDFSIKSWIFRFDLAYHHSKNYKNSIHIPNPEFIYVLAADKRIKEIQFILQFYGKHVFDFAQNNPPSFPWSLNPNDWLIYAYQTAEYELLKFNNKIFKQEYLNYYGIMLIMSKSFFYENLTTSISSIYDFKSRELFFQTSINYNINDFIKTGLNVRIMSGPTNSIYDYSGKILNGIAVELKANF